MIGATNSMRVDAVGSADSESGKTAKVKMHCLHAHLEDCVRQATAAFGLEVLRCRVVQA